MPSSVKLTQTWFSHCCIKKQHRIVLFKCYALHFIKKQANVFNIKCFNSHFSVKHWPHYRPNTTIAVNTGWLVIGTQYGGQGGRKCAGPAGCLSCSSLTLWFTRASSGRSPAVIRARDLAALHLHKTQLKSGFPFMLGSFKLIKLERKSARTGVLRASVLMSRRHPDTQSALPYCRNLLRQPGLLIWSGRPSAWTAAEQQGKQPNFPALFHVFGQSSKSPTRWRLPVVYLLKRILLWHFPLAVKWLGGCLQRLRECPRSTISSTLKFIAFRWHFLQTFL